MTGRLAGERALVTGSTAGIGRAIAVAFAREGAAVVVSGRSQERGGTVVAAIRGAGGVAEFVAADLRDEGACTALVFETARVLGGLTVLVNNAAGGDAPDGPVAEISTEAWEAILRVDLTAPMWCARAAIAHMRAEGRGSSGSSVSTSTPVFVTSRLCSNCAEREPSRVGAVQPSGQMRPSSHEPSLIIGSIVKVSPGVRTRSADGS